MPRYAWNAFTFCEGGGCGLWTRANCKAAKLGVAFPRARAARVLVKNGGVNCQDAEALAAKRYCMADVR